MVMCANVRVACVCSTSPLYARERRSVDLKMRGGTAYHFSPRSSQRSQTRLPAVRNDRGTSTTTHTSMNRRCLNSATRLLPSRSLPYSSPCLPWDRWRLWMCVVRVEVAGGCW